MIQVKADRPIPQTIRGRKPKYPFETMKKGDSFDFPATLAKGSCYGSAMWAQRKYPGRKYIVRAIERGFGCWRTK